MSKHIFTPNGKTPLIVKANDGALKFIFPAPEVFTISNSEILTEFCDWLDGKIENKVRELEAELLK